MKTITEALIEASNKTKKKITYMDIAKVLGYTKQYVSQIKDDELTQSQKEKIEKYYKIDLSKPVVSDECDRQAGRLYFDAPAGGFIALLRTA